MKTRKRDNGYTMVMVLICLAIGSLIIAGGLKSIMQLSRTTGQNTRVAQATYLAQTGANVSINKARLAFEAGQALPTLVTFGTPTNGYSVTIRPFGSSSVTYIFESTATIGDAVRTTQAYAQFVAPPAEPTPGPSDQACIATDQVQLPDTMTDPHFVCHRFRLFPNLPPRTIVVGPVLKALLLAIGDTEGPCSH
jgi:type II secretory pathway pseudopilin PulG